VRIYEHYIKDRDSADGSEERRAVWRTYTHALLDELQTAKRQQESGVFCPSFVLRGAAGDDDLAVRFKPYWSAIPLVDLQELWLALERARYRP
jgi:hypothetical protein